jgi:3-ketosteroid 9alpha-monooxygenase subunit B
MALSRSLEGAAGTAHDHDHGFHQLRVARVIAETAEASSFVLDVPEELRSLFAYDAGQFCTFRVHVEERAHLRCYSMSSSPAVDPELKVTVKRTAGGVVSNWMNDQLRAGDSIEATRPAGVFCLGPAAGDVVAFSAGSGITPVLSLVKTALAATTRRVRLLYANQHRDAVIFGPELDALARQYGDRLSVSHHLDIDRGLLRPETVADFADGADDSEFYICGPGPFMDVVEQSLRSHGVAPARIHIERFTPAAWMQEVEPSPSPTAAATEEAATQVTVELDGRTSTADYRLGTTILQTARQMGLAPPFSCEAGSCATCMARLVEGTVSMHVNNALTDDEVAEGWILTCQAVPTSPSVHAAYSYEEG